MAQSREQIISELYERMGALKRSMHMYMQAALEQCPVSHSQIELLSTIKHLQPVSFKQVAQQLCLTPGAVSQLADPLIDQEFISRETDPNDRRMQCLRLSKKGEKVLQTIEKRRQAGMNHVIESLTTEELTVWARVQEKLITHLKAGTTKDTKK
ncbi:MAG TPA: MarR family transcriptional regulator [Candidatus Saccharimonadales bacterium]